MVKREDPGLSAKFSPRGPVEPAAVIFRFTPIGLPMTTGDSLRFFKILVCSLALRFHRSPPVTSTGESRAIHMY